jgi:hypothetical protein
MAAARRYGAAVEPFASGIYVNDLTDEGEAGIRRAYGTDSLARLARLKDRYDPDNILHLSHNIRPTAGSHDDRPKPQSPDHRRRPRHQPIVRQEVLPGIAAPTSTAYGAYLLRRQLDARLDRRSPSTTRCCDRL